MKKSSNSIERIEVAVTSKYNMKELSVRYWELLKELVKRDLKIKYRRSILGFCWSVLNPLLFMVVTTALFSTIFKNSIKMFPLYFLAGNLIFNLYAESTVMAQYSIIGNGSLIKKVKIPFQIFPLSKICFSFFNTSFSIIAILIVMIFFKYLPPISILLFPLPLVFVFVFSVGIGLLVSALAVFFRDTIHLYGIFLTVVSYFSAIFYPDTILPEQYRSLLLLNPVYAFIKYLRMIMLDGIIPSLEYHLLCVFYCCLALLIGYYYFNKSKKEFILYI